MSAPPILKRVLAAVGLAGCFLVMASVFVPDFSQAGSGDVPRDDMTAPTTDPHSGLPSLGTIEDDAYTVRIFAGPTEPLYSVYERGSDRPVRVLMTARELADNFPELPVPRMDFSAPGAQIMMAEPSGLE